jgi:hypothetical protein
MKLTLLVSALAAAFLASAVSSFGQAPAPTMLNVAHIRIKPEHLQDFLDLERQVAGQIKKGAPTDLFRVVYRGSVGNTTDFEVLTPLRKFADRDGENPLNKYSTEQERILRGARLAQYEQNVQVTIDRTLPDLGIAPQGQLVPPTYTRIIRLRVRNGGNEEFAALVKNDLVPGLKKEDVKLLLVRQTILGGVGDYYFAEGMEKWAEMDNPQSLSKAMGPEAYKKMEDKLNSLVTLREDTIWRYQPDLSYYPGAGATTSSR